jgi:hypothetical protein
MKAVWLASGRVTGSIVQFAQRFQNLIDGRRRLRPAGALNAGQEAIAEASEAQDARIARFSDRESVGWLTTSLG